MPLAIRATAPTTPPVTPGPVSPPVDLGTIRATWTDPTGQVWQLTGPHELYGWLTRDQIAGWGAAPVSLVTDPLARGGVSVRHQRREPRRLTWPLHVYGDTHLQFVRRYRALMRAFTLTKYLGPGVLTVYRSEDSSARQIEAYYEDGFGGETGENWLSANPVLTLLCPDPYWRDVNPQQVSRDYVSSTGRSFLSPYLTVSSSRTLGQSMIANDGDVEAWPSWTITGPATQLTATNTTTGDSFTLTYNLLSGQQATIAVDPTRPMLRGPGGVNLIGSLNWPGAVLWALVPGTNNVDLQLLGSGPGTKVELAYYRRYETA